MAYSKPNPIKQLQSQDQYKQDFEADLMEAGGETPLMKGKKTRATRRKDRVDRMTDSEKKNMKERVADGSNEFEGGSDAGNFLRRNSYNFRKNNTSGGDGGFLDFIKDAQAKQDQKDIENEENYGGPPPTAPPPKQKPKPEKEPIENKNDEGE
tara:strand:- start:407 stop:865 length:459 start_codon:yes stop_codon:yes gene_type:complete